MITLMTLGQPQSGCHWATWKAPGVFDHGDCVLPYAQQVASFESLLSSGELCWYSVVSADGQEETNPACLERYGQAMVKDVDALIAKVWPLDNGTKRSYSPAVGDKPLWPWLLLGAATAVGSVAYIRRRHGQKG